MANCKVVRLRDGALLQGAIVDVVHGGDIIDTGGPTMEQLKATVIHDAKLKIHLEAKRIVQLKGYDEAITHLENELRYFRDQKESMS